MDKLVYKISHATNNLQIYNTENEFAFFSSWFLEFGKTTAEIYNTEEEIIYKITKKFKFWKWRISYEIETKRGKKLVLISGNKQNSIFKLQLNDSNFEVKIHYFDKKSIFKNGVKIAEIDESFFSSKEKNISSVLLSNKEDLELIFLIFSCLKTGETHQKPIMKSQKEWISIKEEWSS
ncbi:hypothetical protein [Polaribacter sp. KT 15]|uniref:tubby C-terminal domain-like protein n=1 Tax=Polaribacter sp. KT 15 TaxID=1896175 RepID=UPI00090C6CC5|nr:hypothetical protein [Polaribacter sp. KT 15]SHM96822.1 hypothetical protein SAMN05720268_1735 [Polaribacter sp. KT 15]